MASAIPVHSSKKGKVNVEVPEEQSVGPVQPSEVPSVEPVGLSEGEAPVPVGVKLESHQAWRVDY